MNKLIFLALCAAPVFAAYNQSRPIVIPHAKVSANLTNFSLTVSGVYPYLATIANHGSVVSSSGYDITFASDSACSTPLSFERAYWVAATGESEFYVKVPTVSHTSDTTIYECYGNSAITTDQQNAAAAWDANYANVNHFVGGTASDSTSHMTWSATGSPIAGRGKLHAGAILNNGGATPADTFTSLAASLQASGSKTFEMWVNPASQKSLGVPTGLAVYGKTSSTIYSLQLRDDGTSIDRQPGFAFFDGTNFQIAEGAVTTPGQWYHVAGVVSSSTVIMYVNGDQYSSSAITIPPAVGDGTDQLVIGRDAFDTNQQSYLDGAIDEVRVSTVARSAAWIKAEYDNESSPDDFYTIGSPVSNSSTFTNVSVIGTTNTQAMIRFTYSGDASSCSLAVSQNSSLFPLAHDVDPSLFANANLVSRDSANIINGGTAQVVAGKRYQAFYGTDGNRYSRALEQNSPYYYGVNCNGHEFEGSFSTRPIAMGDTHLDAVPADTASPGNPAWPTPTGIQRCNTKDAACSIERRDTTYIDPQTGIAIRHVVMPSDNTISDGNIPAHTWTANGWSFVPSSSWNTDGSNATSGSGNTNPLIVGWWTNIPGWTGFSNAFQGGDVISGPVYKTPVMLQYLITANVGNAGCTAGNTNPDCAMQVCITINWQTCAPNAQIYTMYLTTAATQYTFGSGQPYDTMQQPGKRIWAQFETAWRSGNVTCDGSTTITKVWDNGAMPPDEAPAGSYIFIGATGVNQQQIVSNIDALRFTIGTSCPAGTYGIIGSAFGVMAWKQTNSADTLTLSHQSINDLAYFDSDPQYNSGFYGAPSTATLANGDPGGVIQLKQGQYSINLKTGKVGAFMPYAPSTTALASSLSSSFDNLGNMWTIGSDRSVAKFVYHGGYSTAINKTSHPELPLWEWNSGSTLPTCSSTVTASCFDPPVTITLPGQTLDVLLHAFDSRYDIGHFGQWQYTFIEFGKMEFDIQWSGAAGQTVWAWNMIFDPQATSNVNGAFGTGCVGQNTNPGGANYLTPGCIIGARPTWETPGARWMTEKGMGYILRDGWSSTQDSINFGTGPGEGPAVANKISSLTTLTCPSNTFSLTDCVQFVVDGDPMDFQSNLRAIPTRGALGTYMVGDQAMLAVDDITYPGGPPLLNNSYPLLKLVQINGTTLTFGCVYGASQCVPKDGGGNPIDVNPQMLWMYSNWPGFNYPWASGGVVDDIMWNYVLDPHGLNSNGDTLVWDLSTYNAHSMAANSLFSVGGTNSTRCPFGPNCYNNQNFQGTTDSQFVAAIMPPCSGQACRENLTGLATMATTFNGIGGFGGSCGNNSCQTHPDWSKLGSDPVSKYGIDGRPFVGLPCIPCVTDVTQVGSTGSLYKVANISNTLHQRVFDTMVTSSRHVLKNVTGTGSVITSNTSDNYKFCFTLHANECVAGAVLGDFYVNIPYLDTNIPADLHDDWTNSECYFPPSGNANGASANWVINDVCIYDAGMEAQSYSRYALDQFDYAGISEQTFGHLFLGGRADIFTAIHPATNITSSDYSQFYYFAGQFWDGTFQTLLMKAPPITLDSGQRTIFQPVSVNVTPTAGSDHVAIEFGYAEYGPDGAGGFECTPNRSNDPCVAYSSTVNQATPFLWESENPTLPTTGPIAIPALPEHVLYYRPAYYLGSTIVGRGQMQVVTIK